MFFEDLIACITGWAKSRDWRALVIIGAMLGIIPTLVCCFVLWGWSISPQVIYERNMSLVDRLVSEALDAPGSADSPSADADVAENEDDTHESSLALRRILQLGKDNERISHIVALQLVRQGRWGDAIAKLRNIAPELGSGFAPSHLWLAQYQMSVLKRFNVNVLLNDLDVANSSLATMPANMVALHAQLLAGVGRESEALSMLELRAKQSPKLNLALAKLAATMDRTQELRAAVAVCEELLAQEYAESERDERFYLESAELAGLAGKTEMREKFVKAGVQAFPDSAKLRRLESNILAQQAIELAKDLDDAPDVMEGDWQEVMRAAIVADPNGPVAIAHLVDTFIDDSRQLPTDLLEALKKNLESGDTPAVVQFKMGNALMEKGDNAGALVLLNAAGKKDPGLRTAAFNNIAYMMLDTENPQAQEVVKFTSNVLATEEMPDDYRASILDTQGHAYLALGDDVNAIASFEEAVDLVKTKLNSREELAKLYRKAGMEELAKHQERRIEQLKAGR